MLIVLVQLVGGYRSDAETWRASLSLSLWWWVEGYQARGSGWWFVMSSGLELGTGRDRASGCLVLILTGVVVAVAVVGEVVVAGLGECIPGFWGAGRGFALLGVLAFCDDYDDGGGEFGVWVVNKESFGLLFFGVVLFPIGICDWIVKNGTTLTSLMVREVTGSRVK